MALKKQVIGFLNFRYALYLNKIAISPVVMDPNWKHGSMPMKLDKWKTW